MRAQTRPTDDPACPCPPAPWASLSLPAQRAWLATLTTKQRVHFLDEEAGRFLSAGRSARYQKNRDARERHTDGRSIFDDFDADKNNSVGSDDDEPSELILDGSYTPEAEDEAPGPHQDQEAALVSSWADYSSGDALWGKNEWNAVAVLTPSNFKNRDVLIGLARGMTVADIAAAIDRTPRQTRSIIKSLWKVAQGLVVTDAARVARHLDDPITDEQIQRRPPSRAGRKPNGWIASVSRAVDLLGDPINPTRLPLRMRAVQVRGPRRPRVRSVCEGQMSMLFDMAA